MRRDFPPSDDSALLSGEEKKNPRTGFLVDGLLGAVEAVGALAVAAAVDRHLAEGLARHRQHLAARAEHDEAVPAAVGAARVLAHLERARRPHRFTVRPAAHLLRRAVEFVAVVVRGLLICLPDEKERKKERKKKKGESREVTLRASENEISSL